MNFIRQLYTNLSFLTYFFIFAFDLIALKYPKAGIIGTSLWHVSYLLIIVFTLYCLKDIFFKLLTGKFLITALTVLTLSFIVFVNISNPKNFSHEATQEVGCALDQYKNSEDGGFRQTCLFGYPSRQFFLPMWPSLLAGRSQFNLNLGMSFYFFIAIIIFASGMIKHFKDDLRGDLIVGIILSFSLHIYFFNHFMFLYEQSIFPFCFGLILCGLLLHYFKRKSINNLLLMGLTIYYLIYSYTPSLSLVFLSLPGLIYLFFKVENKLSQKKLIFFIFVISLVGILISLTFRTDLHFGGSGVDYRQLGNDLIFAAEYIFIKSNEGVSFINPVLQLVFIFFLLSSLVFIFGAVPGVISWWIIFTIFISVVSEGYSYYVVPMRLHRATVIFPVFFSLLIYLYKTRLIHLQSLISNTRHSLLVMLYLVFFLGGLLFNVDYLQTKEENSHLLLANWFSKNLTVDSNLTKKEIYVVTTAGEFEMALLSMNDIFIYLDPDVQFTGIDDYCGIFSERDFSNNVYLALAQPNPAKCPNENLQRLKEVDDIVIENKKLRLYKIL